MNERAKLLIVDDEPDIVTSLEGLFLQKSYSVKTALSGTEALHILDLEPIDFLITDIRMPGMDGIQLVEQARQIRLDLQCIVLTGQGDIETATEAISLEAVNYLRKPINFKEIEIAVAQGEEKLRLMRKIREKQRQLEETNARLESTVEERTDELKRANNELRRSEAFCRSIINASKDCIKVLDPAGRLLYMNKGGQEQLGIVDITGFIETSWIDFWKGKDHEMALDAVHKAAGGSTESFQGYCPTVQGTSKHWDVVISPIYNHEGEVSRLLAISRDISEWKRSEEKKTRLGTQLQQAQKMQAIGTLAGGIAHEFNNVLGVILGYTDMIRSDMPPHSRDRKRLSRVLKAGLRAKDLVTQILTFCRKSDNKRIPLNLNVLIKESLKLIQPSIPSSIEIRQNFCTETANVLADPGEINQILMNLCANAVHAMREKGVLEISLETVNLSDKQAAQTVSLTAGQYVRLSVKDTGEGLDPQTKERVFEPFFTTKGVGEGTGMGLALVYGIVESYGGAIFIDSEVGKGATFELYFPTMQDIVAEEEAEETSSPVSGSGHILLIDDDEMYAETVTDLLERLGYSVTTMASSENALKLFQEKPGEFDLIITDQVMPGLTGEEVSREILTIRPGTPIIISTGHSTQMDAEKAKLMGIREFAMKPYVVSDIAKIIKKILTGKDFSSLENSENVNDHHACH